MTLILLEDRKSPKFGKEPMESFQDKRFIVMSQNTKRGSKDSDPALDSGLLCCLCARLVRHHPSVQGAYAPRPHPGLERPECKF
jgi:hypothetical protein